MQPFRRSFLLSLAFISAGCSDVNNPTAALTISPRVAELRLGDSIQLVATVRVRVEPSVTWATSDPTVLTVSREGLGRAVGAGTATITAAAVPGRDTLSIAVTVRFASVALSPSVVVCGVATTGAGFCRGPNPSGQLGDGSTTNSTTFVSVAGGHTFSSVFPGNGSTCGLTTDSAAYCWGDGGLGALGVGDTNTRLVPTAVSGGRGFARLAVGDLHACGITGAGAAYCWGWNLYEQAGDTGLQDHLVPHAVPGPPPFMDLVAGGFGTCGLTAAHAAYCWGNNYFGQLGRVTDTIVLAPAPMAGGHAFRSLAIREMQCGLDTNGTVYCWGLPFSLSPQAINGGRLFTMISTSYTNGCGIASDSAAYCWTWDMNPQALPGGLKFTHLSTGAYHDCGISADSAAYCWLVHCGVDFDLSCTDPPSPTALAGGVKFTQISSGSDNQSCGIAADSTISCWYFARHFATSPVAVTGGPKFRTIAVGSGYGPAPIGIGWDYGCGIGADSSAYCWGFKLTMQAGYTVTTSTPTQVPGGLKFVSLDTWASHVCGVAVGGSLYCWTPADAAPVVVPGGGSYVSVHAGFWSNCALAADGTASCWGRNPGGELGVGWAGTQSAIPLVVQGGHAFAAVTMELNHTCGLTTDRVAYCWGWNSTGMLGTGDTTASILPVAVATPLRFTELSAGYQVTCGLIADGSAYCWGRGLFAPTQQQPGTHFTSIAANAFSTVCGVTIDGDVLCWDVANSAAVRGGSRDPLRRFTATRDRGW